jgi:2,4-dienoyl-CoA reductase-like NADH-dependent reductase (Old Yellow Enzyme family)
MSQNPQAAYFMAPLFDPLQIGGLHLNNRIIMAP